MEAGKLAKILLELPPTARVVYPGSSNDIEVEVVGQIDGLVMLSNEAELPGEPTAPEPEPPADLREELEKALTQGRGLLILVHECYALLGAARPIHWLLSGTLPEASEWIRRQGIMLNLIEQSGAAPPPRIPDDVKEKLRETIGLAPKES